MQDAYAIQIVQALGAIVAELRKIRAELESLKIRVGQIRQ